MKTIAPASATIVFCLAACGWGQSRLSIGDAVGKALSSHPLLSAESERIAAAQGLERQAGLRPNPRLTLQSENLRAHGTPGFNYGSDADTFAYLTQSIRTAGKRGRHVELAGANLRRAQLDRDMLARQIAHRVQVQYWNAAAAQQIRDLLRENSQTFQQIVEYHRIRVREGAMAEADLLRVQVESERLEIAANSAALDAERARIQLLREMGQIEFPQVELTGKLEDPPVAPPVADVARALEQRIEIQLARQTIEQARANQRLQQSLSHSDVDVSLGYKRTAGFNTILGGVQWSLPLSDRNQGNIASASAEVRFAQTALAATEAIVRAEVDAGRVEFEIRRKQVSESLRPLVERATESARIAMAAYREGGSDLLRLLDAERLRIDAQLLYYRTLAEYRQSIVALDTAMGVAP